MSRRFEVGETGEGRRVLPETEDTDCPGQENVHEDGAGPGHAQNIASGRVMLQVSKSLTLYQSCERAEADRSLHRPQPHF
jgi:hypothetical protein